MPNHCESDLYIKGKVVDIQRFLANVGDGETLISADKIIPYPKQFKDLDEAAELARKTGKGYGKDGFNSGGYEWCVKNWGTKWGMYNFAPIKFSKTSAKVSFSSAWSPPRPVILEASKQYPNLTFTLRYFERGCEFKGVYSVKNGEILEDKDSTYRGQRGG